MQYLVVGGVLLVIAGAVLIGLLTVLAKIANASGKELGRWRLKAARWISRADLEMQATIPKAIESFTSKSVVDKERIALTNYNPIPYPAIQLKAHKYKEQFSKFFSEPHSASNIVDIAYVPKLLSFDNQLPFQGLLNMENRPSPDYPDPSLKGIGEIEPPPKWNSWVADKTDLEFSVPVHKGWKSIFNRYVIAAYAKEVNRVNQAKLNQLKMEDCFKERDEEMQKLKVQADKEYEEAVALSKKN